MLYLKALRELNCALEDNAGYLLRVLLALANLQQYLLGMALLKQLKNH